MVKNLEFMRELIFENFINKNYIEVLSLSKKYLRKVQKMGRKFLNISKIEFNEAMWYGNYYIGYTFKKMGNIKKAIENIKKSMKYAIQMTNDNQDNILQENCCLNNSRWLLASCYRLSKKTDKAVKIYKKSTKFYKFIEENGMRIKAIFNIALTLKKPRYMMKIIDVVKKENNEMQFTDKFLMLSYMYSKLVNFYIENNRMGEIFKLLHSIEDKKIKKEIMDIVSIYYLNVA